MLLREIQVFWETFTIDTKEELFDLSVTDGTELNEQWQFLLNSIMY